MRSASENILPIVMVQGLPVESKDDFLSTIISSIWTPYVPLEWRDYLRSNATKKNSEGNFVVAENLRRFLLPYQALIDESSSSIVKLPIFFDFFAQLGDTTLKAELKELHLAKMVVLLQLLADPNLSNSSHPLVKNLLWSTFQNEQLGVDTLNLLFSYGLTYQNFLLSLSVFFNRKMGVPTTQDDLLQILRSPEDEKDRIMEEKPGVLYRPILNVLPDSEYIRTYGLLSSAYLNYRNADYAEAARCYDEASELLNKFASQTDLSKPLRDDYLLRLRKSTEYRDQCYALLEEENQSDTTEPEPSTTWRFWNTTSDVKYSTDSHRLLHKKNS